jgi:hypothetical protein
MLHHMIPEARGSGRSNSANLTFDENHIRERRVLHPPEFLARERQFARYEAAMKWERCHISRLLRSS